MEFIARKMRREIVLVSIIKTASSENRIISKFIRKGIGNNNQDKTYHGFEQASGSCKGELQFCQSDSVNPGIQNVHGGIYHWIISIKDLIETSVQDVPQCEHGQQNDGCGKRRKRNVNCLLPTSRTVNGGSFIKCRIDSCQRSQIDDCIIPEFFPYICQDNKPAKESCIAEENHFFLPEDPAGEVHDTIISEDICHDTGQDDPGQEVREIYDRLNCFF